MTTTLSPRTRKAVMIGVVLAILIAGGATIVAAQSSPPGCYYGPPAPNQTVEDQITATPDVPYLVVETRDHYQLNSTHGYLVYRVEADGNETTRVNVTENATVTSSNTSVLEVDESAHTFSTTTTENISTWVRVNATTADNEGCANVFVSSLDLENLEYIPGVWMFIAVLKDTSLFALLIGVLLAVATTRFTTAFGGLAIGEIVLVFGWFAGWVPWEIAVASLFVVLFIGLNLSQAVEIRTGGKGE